MDRFAQIVAVAGLVIVSLVRVARRPMPSAPQAPEPAVTYDQLRHLTLATIFLVFFLWALLWVVSHTLEVLILLSVSIVLAVALRPTVDRVSEVKLGGMSRSTRRAVAILLMYLCLAAFTAGIALLVVPLTVAEVENLAVSLPDYVKRIDEALHGLQGYPFVPDLVALQGQLASQLLGNFSQAINVLLFAVGAVTSLLSIGLVLVFTFLLIMDADRIYGHLTSLFPPSRQASVHRMSARMGTRIEGWLKGMLLLSLILGTVTTFTMWLLGMPYPLLLGVAAGIFELLPMIGPYLGAAPAVLVALFTQPPWVIVAVVIFFVAIQQIENSMLAPQIMGREVELPPLLIILALLLGSSMLGIVGAILAVPVAAVLHVLWMDLLVPEIRRRQTTA